MLQRSPETGRLWRDEIRATLALAWPLILTNIAQALIHVTDVVLLGWAGPSVLAAGTLGVNIFLAFLIFGIGLVTATAPPPSPFGATSLQTRAASPRMLSS